MDGQARGIGAGQRQFGVHAGVADRHRARRAEVHGLPDPGVAVGHERIAVGRVLVRPLIAEVVPVDPVEPAVGQLDAVDVLQRPLRGDLDGQGVGLPAVDPRRHVELVVDVHADHLVGVGHQMTVEPDLGAVVDAGEAQLIRGVPRRRGERAAVPPVLLVEILRYFGEQVLAVVEVRVGAVVLQRLQHGRGHPAHVVPTRAAEVRAGHVRTRRRHVARRCEPPSRGQLDDAGGGLGLDEAREVTGADQKQQKQDHGAQNGGSAQFGRDGATPSVQVTRRVPGRAGVDPRLLRHCFERTLSRRTLCLAILARQRPPVMPLITRSHTSYISCSAASASVALDT